jgi:hypothetical protein
LIIKKLETRIKSQNLSLLDLKSSDSFKISNESSEKKSNRNSFISTSSSLSSSLVSPSSIYSTDEIYNYNEHDSFDATEWIITRL